tara:strand:- start:250 stop:435 length:186 start_codon:yes stop_codon:yes gene_type:complete
MSYNLTNLSLRELRALRKSTDYLPITGIDAIFIGTIQVKINQKIESVESSLEQSSNSETQH